jgi:Ni,Fe-hydrogenase I large subunit
LPPLSKLNLAEADALAWRALEEPVFCTRPLWRNQPAETGALARQQDHPLLADRLNSQECRISARWLARRLELAELPSRLRREPTDILLAQSLAENHGYAWVETARGALLHVAHLEQGRVTAYRIVAPTEWNFHPAGPFTAGINALGETPDLAAAAQALALSLDPCVSYQVEVVDA